MKPCLARRDFLLYAAGAGFALAQSPSAALAQSRPKALTTERLSDRLILIGGAGGNIVATHNADGALLVDGGLEDHSAELLSLVRKETGARRVHTLFNTHWHPEQTGSNQRLGKSGARIIAHENTRLWLGYANPLPGRRETYGPLPVVARPNDTTYGKGQLQLDAETIEYGYLLQAHTDGDLYVHFRNANILVAGDVACAEGWPIIDWRSGGWIGGMVAGLKQLVTLCDADTRIVPGRGPVMTKALLEADRDMYATLFERLEALMRQGKGPDEALAEKPAKDFGDSRGDPTQFLTLAFQSMWGHYAPNA